jgi:hypothetical protein
MEESHFLDMMRVVEPHVSGRAKRSVDLMIQSASLLSSVHHYQEPALSACDTSSDSIDLEAVLIDLQPVCNPAEAELVNLILNFFRSRKIYSAYQAASQHPMAAEETVFNASHSMKAPGTETEEQDFEGRMEENGAAEEMVSERRTVKEGSSAEEQKEQQKGFHGNPNFQNLMENHALQSLLSPSQKENLNRIGSLMQTLS